MLNNINLENSEKHFIYFFNKKSKFYTNLVKKILFFIKKNYSINFATIFLVNSCKINFNIKNNNYFFSLDNDVYIKICIYSFKKFISFYIKNINYNNLLNKILNFVYNIKYIDFDKYNNIPDYNLLSFKCDNLKLFYPLKKNLNFRFNKMILLLNNINNNIDKNITNVENISFNSIYKNVILTNTYNIFQSYNSSYHQIDCQIISRNKKNMVSKYDYINGRDLNFLKKINNFGIDLINKSIIELNPKKIKTGKFNIILKNNIAVNLFYNLYLSILGKYVYLKSTYLLEYINKKIFNSWISILENPRILGGLGSAPFDMEGIKTYKKYIIKNGILKSWILDNYSSNRLKLKNTGNCNDIYNWKFIIKNKNISLDNLIKEMDNGLLVTDILGDGFNIQTGDYSQGISGLFIKNGIIKYPINEVTISGNMIDIFKNIVLMSNDFETRSSINCGSILINNVKVSGY